MTVFSSPPPSFNDEVCAEFSSVCFLSSKGCGHSSTFSYNMFFEDLQKVFTHKNFNYTVVGYVCTAVSIKKAELGGEGEPEPLLVAPLTYFLCTIVCYTYGMLIVPRVQGRCITPPMIPLNAVRSHKCLQLCVH